MSDLPYSDETQRDRKLAHVELIVLAALSPLDFMVINPQNRENG